MLIVAKGKAGKIKQLYQSGTLGLAVKGEIGNLGSRIGDLIGSERITYNPWTYALFHRVALETAPQLVDGILGLYPNVKNVVDFGCGTGVHISEFNKHGVEAEGFEYSEKARDIAREEFNITTEPFDLYTFGSLGKTFDLSMTIEVAEHVIPELGDRLVDLCCEHAPLVVFSAGQPGQAGQGHIHLQPKSYWKEKFEQRGFKFNEAMTDRLDRYLREKLTRGFWLADNIAIYERAASTNGAAQSSEKD